MPGFFISEVIGAHWGHIPIMMPPQPMHEPETIERTTPISEYSIYKNRSLKKAEFQQLFKILDEKA